MVVFLDSIVMFSLPLGALALVAAGAGFFFRPAQPLILAASAVCVAWGCVGFMEAGMFAHVLILPLIIAFGLAVCASLAVRRWMEHGYRQDALRAAEEVDPA